MQIVKSYVRMLSFFAWYPSREQTLKASQRGYEKAFPILHPKKMLKSPQRNKTAAEVIGNSQIPSPDQDTRAQPRPDESAPFVSPERLLAERLHGK